MAADALWAPAQSTALSLQGPAGNLEALLETPDDASLKAMMLVCHPHPQFGGAMTNKVAHTLARAALNEGIAALRFNFRGVGRSEGGFDEGVGETDDAIAMYTWLREQQAALPIVLAGFSFGAAVALRLAARVEAHLLITIAPPLRYFEQTAIPVPGCPWVVVHGDADDVVDCSETLQCLQQANLKPTHHVLKGAGHFFHGQLPELRALVEPSLAAVT
ncbi:MAG: alpha/beta hydrolase [Nevskiales bacterium]